MKKIFKNQISIFMLSYALSVLGSWIRFAITPLYVFSVTGSAIYSGFSVIASNVSKFIFLPFLAPILNRYSKKNMLCLFSFIQGFLVFAYTLSKNINIIFIIIMLISIAADINQSGRVYLIRCLVEKEDLKKVNSIFVTISNVFVFIGPAIGGFLASRIGYTICFYLDALTFFIYGFIVYVIKTSENTTEKNNKEKNRIFDNYKEFVNTLTRNRLMASYVIVNIVMWTGYGGVLAIYPILCINITSLPNSYGNLWSVIGLGQLLGGLIIIKIKKISYHILYYFTLLFSGLIHIFIFKINSFMIILLFILIATVAEGISVVLDNCIIHEGIKKSYMFVFVSMLNSIISLASVIGSTFILFIYSTINYEVAGLIASMLVLCSGALGIVLYNIFNKRNNIYQEVLINKE